MKRPRATWAKPPTLLKTPLVRRGTAFGSWISGNVPRVVIVHTCTTRRRKVVDDLPAPEDRGLVRLGNPRRGMEAPSSIRTRRAAAPPRHDRHNVMIKGRARLNQNQSTVQDLTVLGQRKPFASTTRKMESASSEISAVTPTRRTAKPSPHDLMMHRTKTALTKNPMQKVPVVWPCQLAVTTQ